MKINLVGLSHYTGETALVSLLGGALTQSPTTVLKTVACVIVGAGVAGAVEAAYDYGVKKPTGWGASHLALKVPERLQPIWHGANRAVRDGSWLVRFVYQLPIIDLVVRYAINAVLGSAILGACGMTGLAPLGAIAMSTAAATLCLQTFLIAAHYTDEKLDIDMPLRLA